MSLIKSFGIGNGDMYYIRHGSNNFTMIDCSIPEDRTGSILMELSMQSKDKQVVRFISTHPDQDHISGLVELDSHLELRNFYCVKNRTTKAKVTADFERYVALRDSDKAYYLHKGCKRRWMNDDDTEKGYGSSGINILWPDTSDADFKSALTDAANGLPPNNISPIIKYSLKNSVTCIWMGDLETDFMVKLVGKVVIPKVDILFAPHHGRASGKVPRDWLRQLNPQLVVIGEAPSEYIDYYSGYNIMTQNSCGDILFDADGSRVHVYVGDNAYSVDFLSDEGYDHSHGLYYLGSLTV